MTVDPDRPVYQVNIYQRLAEPARLPEEQRGYEVSEWKLHDVDVPEVLAWAAEKASGQPYTVAVASAETDGDAYLIRLHGSDPTRGAIFTDPYVLAPDVVPDMADFIRRAQGRQ